MHPKASVEQLQVFFSFFLLLFFHVVKLVQAVGIWEIRAHKY